MGVTRCSGRPRGLALLAVYGRTGRPGACFVFGPLKPGFESSNRLASPIGSSARPCGLRFRVWARDGAPRAHFFAAYFGLDTASEAPRGPRSARLGPVLDAGNPQPSASCCTGSRSDGEDELATKAAEGSTSRSPCSHFARTLPTVPRVLRCLEYVVGFSFRVRPTRTRSLQDGWFEPAVRADGCTSRV